jgi:predicted secreted Zn-dependent protease
MAGTKVTVKVAWGKKEKKSSIRIGGKTLGEALKELLKRGEWGEFDGDIGYSAKADANGHVTEITLNPSYTIEMPTWAGYSKAPKACQKEWDRMWKKLEEHENGHLAIHLDALDKIQDALKQQTDLTASELDSQVARIMKQAQDNQNKYDSSTGNGSKKGVQLNITSECA